MEQGKVVQIGSPDEIVTNPADEYVRSFFHGVDVTKVFTGEDLARDDAAALLTDSGARPEQVREQIEREGYTVGVLVDGEGRYQGIVTVDTLQSAKDLQSALMPGAEPANAADPLNDVLHRVAQLDAPAPVVDSNGKYLGSVSQRAMLRTLDRTG